MNFTCSCGLTYETGYGRVCPKCGKDAATDTVTRVSSLAGVSLIHGSALDRLRGITDARTAPIATATKADADKPRMDLIPAEAMTAMGRVLAFGAKKYAARNWERGMEWGRIAGALLRHLFAWLGGEDKDPESGFSHLDHVLTNAAFLVTYERRGVGCDDRKAEATAA